ncbi:MAG: ECF transporter S component [Clostridia bacterium]|nr:ECF transporter S component [Clostridia bacterium]
MKEKKSISIIVISLIPICLAVNVVGGNLASALKIPLYVDSIGTILAGMLCGPAIGLLTGALTGVVSGIFSPIMFAYIPVTAIYGLTAGFLSKKKMMADVPKLIASGIIIALLGVALSSPITAWAFGGITETGQGVIITFLRAAGFGLLPATLISSFCTEFLDKLLSCVVCYIIVKGMSNRYLSKFQLGEIYMKEKKEQDTLFDDDDEDDTNEEAVKNTAEGTNEGVDKDTEEKAE